MLAKSFLFALRYAPVRRLAWRPIYNFLAKKFPFDDWHFMNYGYVPFPDEPVLALPANEEFTRYSIQLYHFLARKADLQGKQVLEVGSGRGGGAHHIAGYFQPASYVGMDIAEHAVAFCQAQHRLPNLKFTQGDAEHLPFPDNSFDVVINVESCHAYGSPPMFMEEVKRVLKPGGYFLITDIRLAQDMRQLKVQLQASGMDLLEEDDITDNVIRAIEMEEPIKEERMRRQIPPRYYPLFKEFAGGVNSEIHLSLKSRFRTYNRFVLQKRP